MLKLIVNNEEAALIEQIEYGEKHINNMSDHEITVMQKLANKYHGFHSDILTVTSKALSPVVTVYQVNPSQPYWFVEGTTFDDDVWRLSFKYNKTIRFDIKLDDNELLTSNKHRPLLNAFKYWIIAQGDPFLNGGKILKNTTIARKVELVLFLIDSIVVNARALRLSEFHLKCLTQDTIKDLLIRIAENSTLEGIYRYSEQVSNYLKENVSTVSDEDVIEFEKIYPLVVDTNFDNEIKLSLSEYQIRQARCYLYKKKAYFTKKQRTNTPNGEYFLSILADSLSFTSFSTPVFNELRLRSEVGGKEYSAIPVTSDNHIMSTDSFNKFITTFRSLICVNNKNHTAQIDPEALKILNIKSFKESVNTTPSGRFTTIPAGLVFRLMRHALEFLFEYGDDILESVYQIVKNRPDKACEDRESYLIDYKNGGFLKHVTQPLIDLGVRLWAINPQDPEMFTMLRNNISFHELLCVYMGALQLVIGSTMARRQGELLDLQLTECLTPEGIDPLKNKQQEFWLSFYNRKSGNSGEFATREKLKKPVLNSVAGLIYKLQKLFLQMSAEGLGKVSKMSLFQSLNPQKIQFVKMNSAVFNRNFDVFCDYFETDVVEYKPDDFRRYYIRSHQLRRFFAMMFFWSKGFDGLDTLRHFLGHTDIEHLYNYITEGVQGEILAGVKAKFIVEQCNQGHIDIIEKLEPILKKRFNTKEIEIAALSELIEDYDYDDFKTQPEISIFKHQQKQELILTNLIVDGVIDLQPEFFSVTDEKGNERRNFNLVLHVFEEE